jgi:FkbM family methyltransferase
MTLLNRRRAACQLGVLFQRSAAFRLPHAIRLNGRMQHVSLPEENGIKVAFIDILLDDCYGCRVLEQKCETVQTVLDIGGNVGLFGIAARNIFPSARIHSYEPNQLLKPYLSVQAEAAQFDYFMEAVGLERGMISLALHEDSVQTRAVRDAEGHIPQVAFREAIERIGGEVDLLKMDCEGDEWTLFEDKHSWRHVKHLCMEYHLFHPGHTEQAVQTKLKGLGFEITSFAPIRHFGLVTASRNT